MLKIIEAKKEDRDTMMNLLEKYPNKDVDYEDGTPADVFFSEQNEDVQNCDVKKGRMGSVLCTLTMKNGTYFKLSLPETAGPNGDMPHHTEYREAILTRLGEKI